MELWFERCLTNSLAMWFSPSSLYKIPTLLSPTTTRKTKPFLCLHPTIKSKIFSENLGAFHHDGNVWVGSEVCPLLQLCFSWLGVTVTLAGSSHTAGGSQRESRAHMSQSQAWFLISCPLRHRADALLPLEWFNPPPLSTQTPAALHLGSRSK